MDGDSFLLNNVIAGLPSVSFDYVFIFTALGAISVNNPVHVHAELYQASGDNISSVNFLQYYDAIGFTDAFDANMTGVPVESIGQWAAIPIREGPYNASASSCPSNACPPTEYCRPNEYCADGDVLWVKDGESWDFLWPVNREISSLTVSQIEAQPSSPDFTQIEAGEVAIVCPGDEACRPSVVTVTGVSDTLSVQNNLTIQRLTFVLLGFSIILLLEIVDTIITEPPKEVTRRQTPPPPPSNK